MKNIMLDLETMGTNPNAAIIAIGAVEFDISTRTVGERFYRVVDLASSVESGGIIDASTVLWWMQQSDEARSAFSRNGEYLKPVLDQFSCWVADRAFRDDIQMWGNGAASDNVILASAYQRCKLPTPWAFWGDRCYRTVRSLYPNIKMQRVGTYHNAVDDAESQARHLIELLNLDKELT
ncbi:MAG: 3'-5' exoribonuclease [Anaerolineaceae bacterium]|nr:3'-5' exoribonuclease [Anaerolineaceae bacterium]